MKKVMCVYPGLGGGLCKAVEDEFKAALGDDLVVNHIGSSEILGDVIAAGGLTDDIKARLAKLFEYAALTNSDAVVCTCSSIGETAEIAAKKYPDKLIMRIDEPMCVDAVSKYAKIGLLATLGTTLAPSAALIKRLAEKSGKTVEVTSMVADGALQAMMGGEFERGKKMTLDAAKELGKSVEAIVLAQASMAVFQKDIEELTGLPVYSSIKYCAEALKKAIG